MHKCLLKSNGNKNGINSSHLKEIKKQRIEDNSIFCFTLGDIVMHLNQPTVCHLGIIFNYYACFSGAY